jgi:hypothetical protein
MPGRDATEERESSHGHLGDVRPVLARIGLVAEGLFSLTVGLLVAQLAVGRPGDDAGPEGAAEQIADQPFGQGLLIVLIAGLVCLVVWRGVQFLTGDEVEGHGLQARTKFGGMVVVYLGVIWIAATVLLGRWGQDVGNDDNDVEEEATAFVLDWPGGDLLVGAVGVGFIVVGLVAIWSYGVQGRFMRRIDTDRTSPALEHKLRVLGRVAYTGRSLVNIVIGALLIVAARNHDPDEAGGMSDALASLADETWGQILLAAIALGFFTYATLRFIEARWRRESRPA